VENRSSGTRNWLIVVVVLVVAGVAAYFAGRFVERNARAGDVIAAQQQYATVKTQLGSAQGQNASLESMNHLLTANVWAYRGAVALDNRNFGVANDAVAKVVANLNGVDAAAAGLDGKAVTAVRKEALGVKISVAANLESQRAQILKLASAITALVGTGTMKNSTP
jgi:hypothetical protein